MTARLDRRASISDVPIEILREIVGLVWLDSIPKSSFRNIDPHGLPSAYPDGRKISSTQNDTRKALYNLCLVNKAFYEEARVLLFRRIQITLPHSFNLLLRTLGASHLASAYEKYAQTGSVNVDPSDPASFVNMVAAAGFAHALGHKLVIGAPTPTPPASRNNSPHPNASGPLKRRRSQRGKVQINADQDGEVELIWTEDESSTPESPVYHVTLREDDDDHSNTLHKWVRLVDFSNFRTQGMRRTIGEGMERRFVTPARLLALVTAAEGLVAFGASETMDSALSNDVLEALLFRDGEYSKPSRLRGVSVERDSGRSNKMLQSLDLCECVSPRFHEAMKEFVDHHLKKFSGRVTNTVMEETEGDEDEDAMRADDDEEEERGRGRSTTQRASANKSISRSVSTRRRDDDGPSRHPARATTFPSLQRLGLSGVTLENDLLNPFVLAFPRLTHLDLSRTKADVDLLAALGSSYPLQLQSLSLAFCKRLTSEAITDLLVDAPCTQELVELSLAGTVLFPTCIDSDDLLTIITQAPCFRSGMLRYVDLGGCLMTDSLLDALHPQPSLLDLGLSSCPELSLDAISRLLVTRAPNVQVLELSDSCTSAASIGTFQSRDSSGINASQLQSVLLGPCAKTPPVPISVQLSMMGFKSGSDLPTMPAQARAATNLRIVGLNEASLRSVRGGLGSWKVIRGAGRRGWVVDTAAGPNPEATDERLTEAQVAPVSMTSVPMRLSESGDDRDHRSPSQNRSVRYSDDLDNNAEDGRAPRPHLRAPLASTSLIPSIRRAHSVGGSGSGSRSRSRHPPPRAAAPPTDAKLVPRDEVVRDLPPEHPRRKALQALADANGHVPGDIGWHSRKMEVLLGYGFLGRDTGLYALPSFQV